MGKGAFAERYGPWAVVTGASDGIGREMAAVLASRGVSLVLAARRQEVLETMARELSERHQVQTVVVPVDLAERGSERAVIEATRALDVGLLVASAGFGTSGPFVSSSIADELAMIDVNCRSVAALTHHFGRKLVGRGRGGVVLLSSLLAFQGVPRAANYAATKAYVQSLAEALHLELAPAGVDVVASAPGPIHSGFAARANMRMGKALTAADVAEATLDSLGRWMTVRPGWLSKLLEASLAPLGRWGRVRMLGLVMAGMTKHHTPALPARLAGEK